MGSKVPLAWGERRGRLGLEPLLSGVCLDLQEYWSDAESRGEGEVWSRTKEQRGSAPVYTVASNRIQLDLFLVRRRENERL